MMDELGAAVSHQQLSDMCEMAMIELEICRINNVCIVSENALNFNRVGCWSIFLKYK